MDPVSILFPMIALVGLTFTVAMLIPIRRIGAGRQGLINADDFALGESARVPAVVSLPNRNLMNLLEMPLLFYVVCLTLLATHQVDGVARTLAWTYVGLRACHSAVHVTYNKVVHRLGFFALSNFVLLAIWVRLLLALLR